MPCYAALDVAQETTAICIVDEAGRILAKKKVATCADAINRYLTQKVPDLVRVGLGLRRLAVWLWNELVVARIAVARKMAVILHAMWKTSALFRWSQEAATA